MNASDRLTLVRGALRLHLDLYDAISGSITREASRLRGYALAIEDLTGIDPLRLDELLHGTVRARCGTPPRHDDPARKAWFVKATTVLLPYFRGAR